MIVKTRELIKLPCGTIFMDDCDCVAFVIVGHLENDLMIVPVFNVNNKEAIQFGIADMYEEYGEEECGDIEWNVIDQGDKIDVIRVLGFMPSDIEIIGIKHN